MWNERNEKMIGLSNLELVAKTKVIIFGVGGVGSYCVEALARSGFEELIIIDFDKVDETNINRQIQATNETIGQDKTEALRERIEKINKKCKVRIFNEIASIENFKKMIDDDTCYVVDAIDMVKNKIDLIEYCTNNGIRIISSLGMAKKLDPTRVKITRIDKTYNDPLAKIIRCELRKRKLPLKLKVAFSDELPYQPSDNEVELKPNKNVLPSMVFVPAAAGLAIASAILRDVIKQNN